MVNLKTFLPWIIHEIKISIRKEKFLVLIDHVFSLLLQKIKSHLESWK